MPGYYIHFAACNAKARNNLSFLRGVEAPDILKKHYNLYGIDGARNKYYSSLKTDDMPEYSYFEYKIQQKEKQGLHYGKSSNPGVMEFWNDLSEEEKQNQFYRGYVWHLLTDAIMYSRLDMDSKFKEFLEENKGNPNLDEMKKVEVKKLHMDWDKTNAKIRVTYPDVGLTPEVEELGVVQFIEDGETNYVDWNIIKNTIDFLRKFDPLDGNMEEILSAVMSKIKKPDKIS